MLKMHTVLDFSHTTRHQHVEMHTVLDSFYTTLNSMTVGFAHGTWFFMSRQTVYIYTECNHVIFVFLHAGDVICDFTPIIS